MSEVGDEKLDEELESRIEAGDEKLDEELDRLEGMPKGTPRELRLAMVALRKVLEELPHASESALGFSSSEDALELCARGGGVLLITLQPDKWEEEGAQGFQAHCRAIRREDAHTLSLPQASWLVAHDDRLANGFFQEAELSTNDIVLAGLEQAPEGSVVILAVGFNFFQRPDGYYAGAVARASLYEPPPGVSAREYALAAAQTAFLRAMGYRALDALSGAEERELMCSLLVRMFRKERAEHMRCEACCPDEPARARAKKELFDSRTCTSCAHGCTLEPGAAPPKILHLHWQFGRGWLPAPFKDVDPSEWLLDAAARERCLDLMDERCPMRGVVGDEFLLSGFARHGGLMGQGPDDLRACAGDEAYENGLAELVSALEPSQMIVTVHLCTSHDFPLSDPRYPQRMRADLDTITSTIARFQKPSGVTWVETSASRAPKKTGMTSTNVMLRVRRKPCGGCARKEVAGEHCLACARCGVVAYCSRDCQVRAWKSGGHKLQCAQAAAAAPAADADE
jgi:hypothetical protein